MKFVQSTLYHTTLLALIAFSTVFSVPLAAQTDTSAALFPASWTGDWKGTLRIFNGKGQVQSIEMAVIIAPLDTSKEGRYSFGLVYGSREKDWRPYELVPVAPEKGLWKVDEKNSIAMESYYYGGKLLCWFVVQDSRVLCTYEKTGDNEMVFEVISGVEKPVSSTGNSTHNGEAIPEVRTFPMSVFQRAMLHRQ